MKGILNNDGNGRWLVIELDGLEMFNDLSKCYYLHPNDDRHQFIGTLLLGAMVNFKLVRHCSEHNCDISESSPCTLDCAYSENEYAVILNEVGFTKTDGDYEFIVLSKSCNHTYSKSMYQEFPRKCVKCGEPEKQVPLDLTYGYNESATKYTEQDLHDAFLAGIRYINVNTRPEDAIDFKTFLERLKNK